MPISDITIIDMKVLSFGDYEKIFTESGHSQEQSTDAIIRNTTGLSDAQIELLSMPDYNSLESAAEEQVNRSSEFYFDLDSTPFNVESPALYDPLPTVETIKYTVPTVKVSRLMSTITDTEKMPYERSKFITKACSGLDDLQISALSVRDWNMLQGRINDFLQEGAGSFQTAR